MDPFPHSPLYASGTVLAGRMRLLMDVPLKDHAVLVTGSSQGIGRAISAAFKQKGAAVITYGFEAAPTDPVVDSAYIQADLIPPECAQALVEKAFALRPDLDILISNAGSFFDGPFLETTPDVWEKTLALNLRAPYFLTQAFARRLVQEQRPGAVVIVASTNGLLAEPDSSVYDISKGGLVMLTRTLSVALAPHAIRVNAIAPGLIHTPLTDPWLSTDTALRAHYEGRIPMGRIGVPED